MGKGTEQTEYNKQMDGFLDKRTGIFTRRADAQVDKGSKGVITEYTAGKNRRTSVYQQTTHQLALKPLSGHLSRPVSPDPVPSGEEAAAPGVGDPSLGVSGTLQTTAVS